MKHNGKANALICLGLLLIFGALGLTGYNLIEERHAGKCAETVMDSIAAAVTPVPETDTELPLYKIDPNVSMPEITVNDIAYVGYLSVPALELTLPVITRTTDYYLTVAPCRFSGSAYTEDLVIGAHNYSTHFGRLKELGYGDTVTFTDMDGNLFVYEVADMETLQPNQDEHLRHSGYPLSLYTCTIGGRTRLTVRCVEAE